MTVRRSSLGQTRLRKSRSADVVADAKAAGLDPQSVVIFANRDICHSDKHTHCSLTLIPAGRAPETIAATDDLPVRVDWLQHQLQQGPALRATSSDVIASKDLPTDPRLPDFGKLCVAAMNLRSMVSVPIPLDAADRAILNFYSSEPTAFDQLPMRAAVKLARRTAPAVSALLDEFRVPLLMALQIDCSRTAIALNSVMSQHRVPASQAFDLLCQAARIRDIALLGVVLEVVQTGKLPGARLSRRSQGGKHHSPLVGGPDMWQEPHDGPALPDLGRAL